MRILYITVSITILEEYLSDLGVDINIVLDSFSKCVFGLIMVFVDVDDTWDISCFFSTAVLTLGLPHQIAGFIILIYYYFHIHRNRMNKQKWISLGANTNNLFGIRNQTEVQSPPLTHLHIATSISESQ